MKDFNIKKLYYSISEVSKITEVEQYVLRYWETEFEQLKPQKNRAGNRAYTNKDIQVILMIKSLLREKKYTIEGAKAVITENPKAKKSEVEVTEKKDNSISNNRVEIDVVKKDETPNLKNDLLEFRFFLENLLSKL
jgi:DNA-binding transcriptional MerR regulator